MSGGTDPAGPGDGGRRQVSAQRRHAERRRDPDPLRLTHPALRT